MPFDEFIDFSTKNEPDNGQKYYLRSVSENFRNEVARLENDFPALCEDFEIPKWIPADRLFSTILRISSADLQIWIHYDVLDNILFQVVGEKSVRLFAPTDAEFLYIQGDKSAIASPENPDFIRFPKFSAATHFIGQLRPGDGIFIPGTIKIFIKIFIPGMVKIFV